MDEAFLNNTTQRLKYFRWLTGAFLIITILATWNLWSSDRTCPTAPLIGIHSFISGTGSLIFRGALIALAIMFGLNVRYSRWALIILFAFGIADDLNRLLPNVYHYAIAALFFALLKKGTEDKLLSGLRIMQAGVYIWTGVLKLNMGFVNQMSDFSYRALHVTHPPAFLKYTILLVAFWEIAIGVAFLTGKYLRVAVISSIAMHVGISAILFAANWNLPFISYNLFLVAANFMLFYKARVDLFEDIEKPKAWIQKIAIGLFLVLPALNLFHWWPDFMSSSLYSCRSFKAGIYIDEKLKKQLPPQAFTVSFIYTGRQCISVADWMQAETGTVPGPQIFIYNKMFKQMQQRYNCTDSVQLLLY